MKIECFLDRSPVVLGNEDGVTSLAGDLDWLMRGVCFVNEGIELPSRFRGCDRVHDQCVRKSVRLVNFFFCCIRWLSPEGRSEGSVH